MKRTLLVGIGCALAFAACGGDEETAEQPVADAPALAPSGEVTAQDLDLSLAFQDINLYCLEEIDRTLGEGAAPDAELSADYREGLALVLQTLRANPDLQRRDQDAPLRAEVVELAQTMDSCDPDALADIDRTLESLPPADQP